MITVKAITKPYKVDLNLTGDIDNPFITERSDIHTGPIDGFNRVGQYKKIRFVRERMWGFRGRLKIYTNKYDEKESYFIIGRTGLLVFDKPPKDLFIILSNDDYCFHLVLRMLETDRSIKIEM